MTPLIALAAVLPLSGPIPGMCFNSTEQAMHAASVAALAVSKRWEVGGALYSHNGQTCYTQPVTQESPTAVDYRIALAQGDKLVALWHTHPGPIDMAGRFSFSDLQLQRRVKVPMYVIVVETGRIMVQS